MKLRTAFLEILEQICAKFHGDCPIPQLYLGKRLSTTRDDRGNVFEYYGSCSAQTRTLTSFSHWLRNISHSWAVLGRDLIDTGQNSADWYVDNGLRGGISLVNLLVYVYGVVSRGCVEYAAL